MQNFGEVIVLKLNLPTLWQKQVVFSLYQDETLTVHAEDQLINCMILKVTFSQMIVVHQKRQDKVARYY